MKPRPWLQELRDCLAMTSYDGRQDALRRWEQRWLVDLHAYELVSPELIASARIDIIERTSEHMQYILGCKLGMVMVEVTMGSRRDDRWGGEPMLEVRGDVTAIRREPKIDD